MPTALAELEHLRRPPLLVRAARIGARDYERGRDLGRLTGHRVPPAPEVAIGRLMSEEAHVEEARRSGAATYSAVRHVALLAALMGEARLARD